MEPCGTYKKMGLSWLDKDLVMTTDKTPTLADFRKWAEDRHHYPVIEAIERYLKMLKPKDTK